MEKNTTCADGDVCSHERNVLCLHSHSSGHHKAEEANESAVAALYPQSPDFHLTFLRVHDAHILSFHQARESASRNSTLVKPSFCNKNSEGKKKGNSTFEKNIYTYSIFSVSRVFKLDKRKAGWVSCHPNISQRSVVWKRIFQLGFACIVTQVSYIYFAVPVSWHIY